MKAVLHKALAIAVLRGQAPGQGKSTTALPAR